jgi:DDE superfamily endonuclease/Fission yeast centromere protein N-terminal domain/Tc5 transposase DNA-binding domain
MTPKSAGPGRRFVISLEQKRAIRTHKKQHPKLSNLAIKQWFEDTYQQRIAPSSISDILSSKFEFLDDLQHRQLNRKHNRQEQWPELEDALFSWMQRTEQDLAISGEILRQKAEYFWKRLEVYKGREMPKFSNGWLSRFQQRRGIKSRAKFGEAASVQEAEAEMECIRRVLAPYEACDIFNCDETGLFWKMVPDRSLSTTNIPGRKKQKNRITIHFCTNMDGSVKLAPWIIGPSKNPHAFRRAGIRVHNLGVIWRANKKAWMTSLIMEDWLRWFDIQMALRQRKVVLLMDNFSAHEAAVENIQNSSSPLTNTFIIWLPPNSTSKYQPLDQGIIRTWKAYWKRDWVRFILAEYEAGRDALSTVTYIDAIRWATRAWNFDISEKTITNCFYRALSIESSVGRGLPPSAPVDDIHQGLRRLEQLSLIQDPMNVEAFLNPVEEAVQDEPGTIEELVLSQIQGPTSIEEQEDEQGSEGEGEALPRITVSQALAGVRTARLLEEQREEGDLEVIQALNKLERRYLTEEVNSRRQSDIRSWLGQ